MKKLLAMLLAALMLVCVGAAALADASITFQMGGEPECMDPTINDYSSGSYALQSLFRGLYKYDADGALVPAMAESYEVSEDGCTYTFKLKEGLKWSDGSPLTAHDFEYSWKRVLNPEVGSETAYTLYGVIKDGYECFVNKTVSVDDLPIRALDDTTFQVELKAPASYFLTLTASTAFMPVSQANVEKYGEDWANSPETYVCNGSFMLADMKKDESYTFVKNPNYYNADEVQIDTVNYVFLKGEEIIAVVRLARSVVILTGEAADGEDGGIRKRARLLHEFVAQNGFARFARRRARGKLRADVFGIKPLQRLKNLDLAFPLLDAKPLSQRTDVSDRRIAASAAALDIIRLRFSKHRHARAVLHFAPLHAD